MVLWLSLDLYRRAWILSRPTSITDCIHSCIITGVQSMSIQAKVADCEDIEANVRKFLVERAASSHHTFMPFSVERVPKFYRTGITSYRAMMYRTVAQSMGKPQPYLQPIHSNSKKLNRSTVQYGSREKQHLLDGAMFQTFYAEKMSLEKPTARPRKSQRKVVASKPHL